MGRLNQCVPNKDLFITLNSNTLSAMKTHFSTKLSPARPVYEIIVPTKWKKILLNGELSPYGSIDTDGDTLTDWEEVDRTRLIWNDDGSFDIPTLNMAEIITLFKRFEGADYSFLINNCSPRRFLPIFSDPTEEDSDGDGLLDGEPKKYHTEKCDNKKSDNCKIMLPIDPHPLCYDGPKGVWNAQKKVVECNNISTGYGSNNDGKNKLMNNMADSADTWVNILLNFKGISNKNLLNFIRKYIKGFAESEISTKAGADFLDFIYDNKNIAYHSQVDTWQKDFGYNDIYDEVFENASNMKKIK